MRLSSGSWQRHAMDQSAEADALCGPDTANATGAAGVFVGPLTSGPATPGPLVALPAVQPGNLAHWMPPPVTKPATASMPVRLLWILGLSVHPSP
jgi:hypothetical protein